MRSRSPKANFQNNSNQSTSKSDEILYKQLDKEIDQVTKGKEKLNREELKELLQKLRFSECEKEAWRWMKGDQKGGVDIENLKVFLAAVMNLKIDGITIIKDKKKEENNVVKEIIKKVKREKSLKHKKMQNKRSHLTTGKLIFKSPSAITQTHIRFKSLSDSRYHYLHLMKNSTHTLFYSKNSKYSKTKFAKDDDDVIQSPSPKNKLQKKRRCYSSLKHKANIGKSLIARIPPSKPSINKNERFPNQTIQKANENNQISRIESKINLKHEENKNQVVENENSLKELEDDESIVEFNDLSEDLS